MNGLRWKGTPGHYEVWYLTLTEPQSGIGVWIRYTMLAPLSGEGTCSLWFLAMDRAGERVYAHKDSFPAGELHARAQPFELRLAAAILSGHGMQGSCGEAEWDLHWEPGGSGRTHVHPLLERAKIAKTVLTLPEPDLRVSGAISIAGEQLTLDNVPGGQAHLWGSKHALRWAWAHCNDFRSIDGEPRPGSWLDAVSVWTARFGREIGPSSPAIGRFLDSDFASISPLRVARNASRFGLQSWHFEASERARRIVVSVDAPRESLLGVTYTDPDGEHAYCYNSEVATLRARVFDRARGGPGWLLRETLVGDSCSHYEYAQREALPEMEMHVP